MPTFVASQRDQRQDQRDRPSRVHPRRAQPLRSTPTSVRFDPRLPFEDWRAAGVKIATCSNASMWWLGDWLVFGRYKYGPRYRQAIGATGLDYQTLRNYAVVARRFEPARRRANVSFQHHAEVCALPDDEQDYWLDQAAADRWSRNELRRRLRASSQPPSAPREEWARLDLSGERATRWREAAARRALNLESWIESTLDEAAEAILGATPTEPLRSAERRGPPPETGQPSRAGAGVI